MNILKGYKTYILCGLGILDVVAYSYHLLDVNAFQTILLILGFGSTASLRAAIKNDVSNIVDENVPDITQD